VHDEDTLARYKRIVNRVNRATKLADFSFNISVSYDPGMPVKLKDEVNKISVKLIENNVEFSVKVAHGAGFSLFNIIEENLSNMSVDRESFFVCCVDGDSYPIDDVKFLRQVRKIADEMARERAIIGLAQRTKIILPGASELYREIDEMVFALCLRGKMPVKRSVLLRVPPAYAEFGDPVPGFYCLNMTHPKIGDLFRTMEEDMVKSDMTHFTGDFYLVLAAAQMGRIVTDIVPLEDNPPGSFSLDSIRSKSRDLGRTSLRKVYLAGVKSEENRRLLEKHYPPEDVEKVRDTILKAMLR
jgi:hypothetical protein